MIEKTIGELFVIGFDGKVIPESIKQLIHNYHIGGIILFTRNIGSPNEVLALTASLQKEARDAGYERPLLICVDQENGTVRRLGEGTTIFPGGMTIGASDSEENAYQIGYASGKELRALGINWNLAPVVDVNVNPDNPVIGVRSYGESPERVTRLAKAAVKGMQDAGVVTTLKHFPGHGDTKVDSHLALPVIPHNIGRLEDIELRPFRECLESDVIMSAHIYFPALEPAKDKPATLSKEVMTGLLRDKLGYTGLITTDCMEMNAISETIGTEKGVVAALQAGVDLAMVSHTLQKQIGALKEVKLAVESGKLSRESILSSVKRIRRVKDTYINWNNTVLDSSASVPSFVGGNDHRELAKEAYRQGVTMVYNHGLIPIDSGSDMAVVTPLAAVQSAAEDSSHAAIRLYDVICAYQPHAKNITLTEDWTEEYIHEQIEHWKQYDAVIFGVQYLAQHPVQQLFLEILAANDVPVIAIVMKSPYDVAILPELQACICTYEVSYPALEVAASAVFGKGDILGGLPVTIN
ncbi:beta-N-acetylhexosaminidase [Oceanobacillus kimchii]|uniref:Beta-glucosidase n=1 Tax=Oceanobacillus kimchii TaxID=746691 RepID=A0ABQ5TPZ9_9BACI|nr:beta-N-acetylhexosaminidase [Oceanobacillus kimchii]GLO67901.1 beta-glucosidase [Oceanobacillus kimchii]